jgi:transcription termination/antitermination protein NusG
MSREWLSDTLKVRPAPLFSAAGSVEETPWHVIHTRCHHEARVAQRLARKGLEIFFPRVTVPSRRRDRQVHINLPLFPGYLFVRHSLEAGVYLDIINMTGVARILGGSGRFAPVPPETIDSIKLALDSPRPCASHTYIKRGRKVRIAAGPLTGVIGIIVALKEKKRKVVVNVELFRRAMAVELTDEAVEPWYGC